MKRDRLLDRYYAKVLSDLKNDYNLDVEEAKALLERVNLSGMIDDFPEEVTHYPTKYWADKIYSDVTQLA
jgi:hypothetical protein